MPKKEYDDQRESMLTQYLHELLKRFPDERDCVDAVEKRLEQLLEPSCHGCGGNIFRRPSGKRFAYCACCGKKVKSRAGTLLRGLRSARPLLFVIWLRERDESITGVELGKIMNFPLSTARRVIDRLKTVEITVLQEVENENGATELVVAAQQSGGQVVEMDTTRSRILDCVSGNPVTLEAIMQSSGLSVPTVLSALTLLELEQLVERLPGDRYVRKGATASAAAAINDGRTTKRPSKSKMSQNQANDFFTLTIRIARDVAQHIQIEPSLDG